MSVVIHGNEENFQTEVLASEKLVLVDFYASWCSHCTRLSPVLDEIATELDDKLKIVKINVDESKKLAERYGVMSLPTMLFFKTGSSLGKLMGYMPKEKIVSKIETLL